MPKIPNWSKLDDMTWEHDEVNAGVEIVRDSDGYYVIFTQVRSRPFNHYDIEETLLSRTTKEDAKSFARNWMRRNPSP